MNVVIGYDGSSHAKAAIDDLRRAGLPRGGNALVVTVGDTMLPMPSPSMAGVGQSTMSHRVAGTLVRASAETAHAIAEADTLAREGVLRFHTQFPRWGVYADSVRSTVAKAIMQEADDWRADLVVVGSHGRRALGRLLVGSVSNQLATESRCSVRVARRVTDRRDAPVRVILGVDGSPGAKAASHAVASRSWPAGTQARVIAVDDTVRPAGTINVLPKATAWISDSNHEQLTMARAMLEQATNALREAGMQVSMRTPKGRPLEVLVREAAAWEADCIFVGALGFGNTRGRSGAGTVSTALITHAPCSVEIIRA